MAVGVKLLHIVSDNTGLYCPRFERCGDESAWVSNNSFRTRKLVLLLSQLPEYDEMSRPECFSK